MTMDLAAINPLLKDEYEDYVSELVHTETVALDLFTEGENESADGRRVIIPAHVRRDHAGVMFVGEGRQLPTPAAEQSEFFTIPYRKSAARFQITKEAVDQAQTSRGSFVRTLSFIMDHLVENLTDIRNKAIDEANAIKDKAIAEANAIRNKAYDAADAMPNDLEVTHGQL